MPANGAGPGSSPPPSPSPSTQSSPSRPSGPTALKPPKDFEIPEDPELSPSEDDQDVAPPPWSTTPLRPPEDFNELDGHASPLSAKLSLQTAGLKAFKLPSSPASASPESPRYQFKRTCSGGSIVDRNGRSTSASPPGLTRCPTIEEGSPDPPTPLSSSPRTEQAERGRSRGRRASSSASTISATSTQDQRPVTPYEPYLEGHGETTYAPVPAAREMFGEDRAKSQSRGRERNRSREPRMAAGSMNGHYLRQYHKEKGFTALMKKKMKGGGEKPKIHEYAKPHDVNGRLDARWTQQHVDASSSTPWMNETWGPQIKDYSPSTRPVGTTGQPSRTRHLTPQYNGGKVSAKRVMSAVSPIPQRAGSKRAKKEHSSSSTPPPTPQGTSAKYAGVRTPDGHSADPTPKTRARRPKLRVRKAYPLADAWCGVCEARAHRDGGPLLVCGRCERSAYCSRDCLERGAERHGVECGGLSERPDRQGGTAGGVRERKGVEEVVDWINGVKQGGMRADEGSPVRTDRMPSGSGGLQCAQIVSSISSPPSPVRIQQAQKPSQRTETVERVGHGDMQLDGTTSTSSPTSSTEGLSSEDDDTPNTRSHNDQKRPLAHVLHTAPSFNPNMNARWKTRRRFVREGMAALTEAADAEEETRPVIAHRIVKWRYMDYCVQEVSGPWPALSLHGAAWTRELALYWTHSDLTQRQHDLLEIPAPWSLQEPGPYGRFIKRAALDHYRVFDFDVREFERVEGGEAGRGNFRLACELGPEWDTALRAHFRLGRCGLRREWDFVRFVRELGFVSRGAMASTTVKEEEVVVEMEVVKVAGRKRGAAAAGVAG